MKARVEQLALSFRLPSGATGVHAELPSLERAMHARLADELMAQLESIDDGGDEVLVVQEATARVTLRLGAGTRELACVEHVSRAARDAVIALLARPGDDADLVRRFPSDAAYLGSFVVELLDGTAWDRWYFGSFQRFRRSDDVATILALLADAETDCIALFARLEARGRLADVLQCVGPTAARTLASASPRPIALAPPVELAPLSAAGFAIADTLGVRVATDRHAALLAEFHRLAPERVAWLDRATLTEWVWRFTRWIIAREANDLISLTAPPPPPALVSLVAEQLDWLDGEWLISQAMSLPTTATEPRTLPQRAAPPPPTAHAYAAQLRTLAEAIRSGSLRLDIRAEPHDQLLLRLLAGLPDIQHGAESRLSHTLVALLDRILDDAERILVGQKSDASSRSQSATGTRTIDEAADGSIAHGDAADANGSDADALLRAILSRDTTGRTTWSKSAGLYLLTRPIVDLHLDRLAKQAGVPWAPLLASLAMKLFGIASPYDHAARLWIGDVAPEPATLDTRTLHALQRLVLETLAAQRLLSSDAVALSSFEWRGNSYEALSDESGTCWPLTVRVGDSSADDLLAEWRDAMHGDSEFIESARAPINDLESFHDAPALPADVDVYVTSLATCVLRAMSRWLPGLSGSSAPFLLRNFVARGGILSADDELISVVLDRAPLDVVLDMAGCFAPMTKVSWLDRGIRFSLARPDG